MLNHSVAFSLDAARDGRRDAQDHEGHEAAEVGEDVPEKRIEEKSQNFEKQTEENIGKKIAEN